MRTLVHREHGHPVRLIVPGWYGVASVKWVTRIQAVSAQFDGYYQTERYVLVPQDTNEAPGIPLTTTAIRSVIAVPEAGAGLACGLHFVRGYAWSGAAPILRVEVSVDEGATWDAARLTSPAEHYAWRRWEYRWHAATAGPATLMSRAVDASGNQQPDAVPWNRFGYANNAVQGVRVYMS